MGMSILAGEKVGARMEETGGRTTGFDYMRIFLATAVLFFHSRSTQIGPTAHIQSQLSTVLGGAAHAAVGPDGGPSPLFLLLRHMVQPFEWSIVPCFFALSGFLVAGSLMRSKTIFEFIVLRVLRIIPALFVETMLFAFILGPIITEFSLYRYFTSAVLWQYPLNIVGNIHYHLPGVFLHNPLPGIVNGQLWTIPAEFLCYAALAAASITGLIKRKSAVPLLTICAILVLSSLMYVSSFRPNTWDAGAWGVDESTLLLSFLMGVTIYIFRDRVPLNNALFGISAVASFALLWNGDYQFLATIPISYATVFLGLTNFRKVFITVVGDYSYGIYLYGYPIQQFVSFAFPQYRSHWVSSGFVFSLAITTAVAALSWHFLESRVLDHRKVIIGYCQRRLDFISAKLAAFSQWLPKRIPVNQPSND